MKNLEKETKGTMKANGAVRKNIEQRAASTGEPKNSVKVVENKVVCKVVLNKSQKKTIEMKAEAEKRGVILSDADCRMLKKEGKLMSDIQSSAQEVHYFETLQERVGQRGMMIVMLEVIWLIKPKCPMPKNSVNWYNTSVALAEAQTLNTAGFFTVAFPTLAVLIAKNVLLHTAITNFTSDNGTGSTEMIEVAVAAAKVQVDLLVVYVTNLCIANQANAAAIITAAKMEVIKQKSKNVKPDFQVLQGATTQIKLISLAVFHNNKRVPATYYWQYGIKALGVIAWTDLPDTNVAKTTALNMPIETVVYFRKATNSTKGGRTAWCAPVPISPK